MSTILRAKYLKSNNLSKIFQSTSVKVNLRKNRYLKYNRGFTYKVPKLTIAAKSAKSFDANVQEMIRDLNIGATNEGVERLKLIMNLNVTDQRDLGPDRPNPAKYEKIQINDKKMEIALERENLQEGNNNVVIKIDTMEDIEVQAYGTCLCEQIIKLFFSQLYKSFRKCMFFFCFLL